MSLGVVKGKSSSGKKLFLFGTPFGELANYLIVLKEDVTSIPRSSACIVDVLDSSVDVLDSSN